MTYFRCLVFLCLLFSEGITLKDNSNKRCMPKLQRKLFEILKNKQELDVTVVTAKNDFPPTVEGMSGKTGSDIMKTRAYHIGFILFKYGVHIPSVSCLGWKLVFRGLSGIGQEVYKAWTKTTPSRCTLTNGCIPENMDLAVDSAPNNTHLKSPLVARWTSLNIEQVKLEFHEGKRLVWLIFNGTGSSYTNWFTKQRLLDSNFDDLYSDGCLKYFTITGYYSKKFLISQEGYACSTSIYWWISVVESKSSRQCRWEHHTNYPVFVYAPNNHKSKFSDAKSTNFRTAAAMAIYIKRSK